MLDTLLTLSRHPDKLPKHQRERARRIAIGLL